MMDGFHGFRSRFDDLRLVHEILEEVPHRLGCKAVMPPFLLPYYDGVEPDDCGISSFVFLGGGHLTVHTFSFRECFFADLVSPEPFDVHQARYLLETALPVQTATTVAVRRAFGDFPKVKVDEVEDFGPHLFMDLEGYEGPTRMEEIFRLMDEMPPRIGMTPIMRPYVLPGAAPDGRPVVSAMTMIAESHIALHVYPEERRAWFDIFSCRFFDRDVVLPVLRRLFPSRGCRETLIARGTRYRAQRTERPAETTRSRAWLGSLPGVARDAGLPGGG